MAQKSRTILKTYYETGDYPTEDQFADFIDSCLNLEDDPFTGEDKKVSISVNDQNTSYLGSKLFAGSGITLTIDNPKFNETLRIRFTGTVDEDADFTGKYHFNWDGQAHGGYIDELFTASKTFDAENGNNQEMEITASTTIGITNEQPGTYLFWLPINTAGSPTITIGASFGDVMANSADIDNSDGATNILTLAVSPSGLKKYSINTQV